MSQLPKNVSSFDGNKFFSQMKTIIQMEKDYSVPKNSFTKY